MESVQVIPAGQGKQYQTLSQVDRRLVTISDINSVFGESQDYIEIHIYDELGNLLLNDYDATDYYPFLTNNPKNNTYSNLVLDPEKDLKNRGFNRGNLNIEYNFYKKLFSSNFGVFYWIKEISNSRTELKLASQVLSDSAIRTSFAAYQSYISGKNYYPTFYLNFGNNQTVIATNVAFTSDDEGAYLLIKLYEPLPSDFDVKSQLWIVDKIANSTSFNVNIQVETEDVVDSNRLRGANYNVIVNTKNGQTTPYYNYQNLLLSPVTSSYQKLKSFYQDKGIELNIDYSDFSNFVHFSSAVQRVNNFVYKLQIIESASINIVSQSAILSGGSAVSSSITIEQQLIDNTIKNFDIYEYFLYFESSSWAWPKSNSVQPYELYSVTSSEARNFLGSETTVPTATTASILFSASYYDSTNKDTLHQSIPQYILDDPSNQPYITFLDMIGQHFDNIWVYYQDVSKRFEANNNPKKGISLDLVSDALRGLGMQLYTNTNVSDNLYYTLFGINPDGSLLPPTGSEIITNYVTSSIGTLPAETLQDEVYKRLYHNLPYLLKTKGTARGIKSLVTSYGIPESMLKVREFGGNIYNQLDGIIDLDTSEFKVSIVTGSSSTPYLVTEILEYIISENDEFLIGQEPLTQGSVTGSLTISSSLLSPYTTIQYYQGNTRLNSTNVEVGFSPSDTINANIVSSSGLFLMDQLIGSPGYMYSSSYEPLVSASNAYFSSYTQQNSIWEYVRLLKFYNNSLFKTIKDFVPARANVSTGIIIKSHMYERNKYARHEPSMSFNDYSQSIELLEISADNGGALSGSTNWSGFVITPMGLAAYSSSQDMENYTGELSGSEIVVTSGEAMEQREYSSVLTGSYGELVQLGATYQNVTFSVKSQNLLDLDYTSDQMVPVNYGAVTYSLDQTLVNNYNAYTNPNNPFAQVQDYNYNLERSVIPRYVGSSVFSALYNVYTPANDEGYGGDQSYGKTAAIDKIKYQYAYITDIYSSSFQMPYRAQGQIKYIIDNQQNVINLSKNNVNWFLVQNVFKSGEYADVSLFDFDPTNPYIQRLNNSANDFTIWESGYSYTPILYNPSGSLTYILTNPETFTTAGTATTYVTLSPPTRINYWTLDGKIDITPVPGTYTAGKFSITGSSVIGVTSTSSVLINCRIDNQDRGGSYTFQPFTIPAGTTGNTFRISNTTSPFASDYYSWLPSDNYFVTVISQQALITGSASTTTYVTASRELNTSWQVTEEQNVILMSPTQSRYYGLFTSTGSYAGLDSFVFPFEINNSDIIRLYNYSTSMWEPSGEFRVVSVLPAESASVSYYAITVDREIPLEYTVSSSNYPLKIEKYLVLKRLEDETSIYFNYDLPKPISQDGTLFPQYIGEGIKEGSGNVIKALKQQNLI